MEQSQWKTPSKYESARCILWWECSECRLPTISSFDFDELTFERNYSNLFIASYKTLCMHCQEPHQIPFYEGSLE